jgi:hypothetical protein
LSRFLHKTLTRRKIRLDSDAAQQILKSLRCWRQICAKDAVERADQRIGDHRRKNASSTARDRTRGAAHCHASSSARKRQRSAARNARHGASQGHGARNVGYSRRRLHARRSTGDLPRRLHFRCRRDRRLGLTGRRRLRNRGRRLSRRRLRNGGLTRNQSATPRLGQQLGLISGQDAATLSLEDQFPIHH